MRILEVAEPADGGVAQHLRDLVEGLVAAGHDVQAVVSERGSLAEDLGARGAGVVQVPFVPETTAPGHDVAATRRLLRLLRPGRWDVVHTHSNKAGVLARPLAHRAGMPVVHSSHGFAYLSQEHRPRPGQAARRSLTLGVERRLAPAARRIVCVSAWERDRALRDGVAEAERLRVVPNGVRLVDAPPDPRLRDLPGEGPVLGFLARLHESKGPLEFVDALGALRDRGVAARGAVVGDGPLRDAVLARVRALGLDDRVTVHAFRAPVSATLRCFDVYVLPSRWESLPIGALEAMAAALPVVATDVGGTREAVEDGLTGRLVAPHGLAEALAGLARDHEARRRLGAAGRARYEAGFTVESMVSRLEAVYREAVAAGR